MNTSLARLDPAHPDPAALRAAAEILRANGLVAFPTETVYGLGALALSSPAVQRIYEAKGRPSSNPIIVHLADFDQLPLVAAEWPDAAQSLAARFWPGPLTLVVKRTPAVPDTVTGGGPTVALRIPNHPVALALLQTVGAPIAAPSANRSNFISPTTADHVLKTLGGRIEMILDGGPCSGGLESTVLSLADPDRPRILRPGLLGAAQLEAALGRPLAPSLEQPAALTPNTPLPAPGMLERHYAPNAQVLLVETTGAGQAQTLAGEGHRVGYLPFGPADAPKSGGSLLVLPMPTTPDGYAALLYARLHELDDAKVDQIVIDLPPTSPEWSAIHDRLRRAAAR